MDDYPTAELASRHVRAAGSGKTESRVDVRHRPGRGRTLWTPARLRRTVDPIDTPDIIIPRYSRQCI